MSGHIPVHPRFTARSFTMPSFQQHKHNDTNAGGFKNVSSEDNIDVLELTPEESFHSNGTQQESLPKKKYDIIVIVMAIIIFVLIMVIVWLMLSNNSSSVLSPETVMTPTPQYMMPPSNQYGSSYQNQYTRPSNNVSTVFKNQDHLDTKRSEENTADKNATKKDIDDFYNNLKMRKMQEQVFKSDYKGDNVNTSDNPTLETITEEISTDSNEFVYDPDNNNID